LCNENIARCEGHLKICKEIDPEIKQQYFSSSSSSSSNSQQIVVVQKQNNITNFLDRISSSEQKIAYLLDSRFQGKTLADDIMTTVSDFIKEYYPKSSIKIYSQILEYLAHSGSFNNNLTWETNNS
ncbi:8900_t:CDS:2, partial [Cetraspora pellucida]